jgi:hypothetical protein
MKRIVVSAFLVLGMSIPLATPAQAIFGWSTCEKAKKAITEEEKVGLEFHKKYQAQRKILLSMTDATWENLSDVFSWLPDVYDSDLRVYKIVDKNQSCFTTKDVVRARTKSKSDSKQIKDIELIRKAVSESSVLKNMAMKKQQFDLVRDMYPNYYTFVGNKKLN